jgi:hypothetical protein
MIGQRKIPQQTTHAVIRENALVLSLDKSDMPVVARFDLDSLAQANFVVQQQGADYQLTLRDFSGTTQPIAQFTNKIDAHQALNHILQALVTHSIPKEAPAGKSTGLIILRCLLALFAITTFLMLIVFGIYGYSRMNNPAQLPLVQSTPSSSLPEGEPQDLENLLSQFPTVQR